MIRTDLPWGVMPDVLVDGGEVYIAFSDDNGLHVWSRPEYDPTAAWTPQYHVATEGVGWARLTVHNGSVLVAYKEQPSQNVVVIDVDSEQEIYRGLNTWGNNPVCWDVHMSGMLSVQHNPVGNTDVNAVELWQGVVPNVTLKGIGTAYTNGQGLAFTQSGFARFMKDANDQDGTYQVPASNDLALYVGQSHTGGVFVNDSTAAKSGVLYPGVYTGNPRTSRQSNGKIAIIYWAPKEIGNMVLVTDLAVAEIEIHPPVVNVPALGAKAVGSFYCTSPQYGNFEVPGNFEILFDDYNSMKIKRPVVAGRLSRNVPPDKLMGWWAPSMGDVNWARAQANKRCFLYTDSPMIDSFNIYAGTVRTGDVLMPQAYLGQTESLSSFETRIQAMVSWNRINFGMPQMLVVQAYDRNGWHTDLQLQQLMEVYNRLVRLEGVVGLTFFAYARPQGIIDHPSLLPWVQAYSNATSGLPAAVQPPVATGGGVQPPKVVIVGYGAELTSHNVWTALVRDGNNPNTTVVIEFVNGSLHVRLTNPAGTDRSGLQRMVDIH